MPDDIDPNGLSFGTDETASPVVEEPPEPYSTQFFKGDQFLQTVPEQDRPIVQRYLNDVMKGWDDGLNKKFEESANKLKAYGDWDPEVVQRAVPFYEGWSQDPENTFIAILGAIAEHSGGPQEFAEYMESITGIRQTPNGSRNMDPNAGFNMEDEEDPNAALIQQMGQQLQEFNQWREEFMAQQEDTADSQLLDSVLGQMHTQYGQFDERAVLVRIADGMTPEQAYQDWHTTNSQYFGGNSQSPRPTPPKVMGGQGGIPSGQVDPSNLKGKDRRSLVQQYLEAQQQ